MTIEDAILTGEPGALDGLMYLVRLRRGTRADIVERVQSIFREAGQPAPEQRDIEYCIDEADDATEEP